MKQATRWEQAMRRVDELPASRAGLLGFVAFLFAGLVVLHLPTWGFVLGLLGLLSLLVWLALSGQPVVKLIWPEQPEAVPAILSPPKPVRTDEPLPMVELPGGEFWMGSPESEPGRYDDELRHRFKVSAFAIGKYPVTRKQYREVMAENPSFHQGELKEWERPVEQVSWFDAVRFCNRLSEKVGRKQCYRITEPEAGSEAQPEVEWDREADGYRLPTEAEWEYACRAGTETAYSFGDEEAKLGEYAWFEGNSDNQTHTVGQKKPNGWDLHDLHGNVWEWCWDWYDSYKVTDDNDKIVKLMNPIGPPSGSRRVLRGGSFRYGPRFLRSAFRFRIEPVNRVWNIGFRCVMDSGRQP